MWEINLLWQIITFILSFVIGVGSCLIYDTFRTIQIRFSWMGIAVFITDILLSVIFAFITFCFFIARTNGEIRAFVFIGQLAGIFICRITLSKPYKILLSLILNMFCLVKKLFNKYISVPIYRFFNKIAIVLRKIPKKLTFFAKKRLKKHNMLVYTKENARRIG